MKKIFNTSDEVIHLFAERSQHEATNSSRNVYFHGDKLFSYGQHYVLAEYITNPKKELAVMINDEGYSVTTSKHIRQAKWALSQYKQFNKTETNAQNVFNQLKDYVKSLSTARKPELYVIPAQRLFDKFVEFQEWKGEPYKRKTFCSDFDGYSVHKNIRFNDIKKMYDLTQKGNDPNALKEMQEAAKKAAAKRKAEKRKAEKEARQKWIEGETRTFYSVDGEDILRMSKDGQSVETSQGVSVPRKAAKVLFDMIEQGRDIKGVKIEQYTVISINGTLKIGCHKINMDSVRTIGKQL